MENLVITPYYRTRTIFFTFFSLFFVWGGGGVGGSVSLNCCTKNIELALM